MFFSLLWKLDEHDMCSTPLSKSRRKNGDYLSVAADPHTPTGGHEKHNMTQLILAWLRLLSNGEDGSLSVQGVEDSLHDDAVGTAFHKSLGLFPVSHHQLVKSHVSEGRIFHVLVVQAGSLHGSWQ